MYREQDSKRRTYSLEYVDALERRISTLENTLARVKEIPPPELDAVLDTATHPVSDTTQAEQQNGVSLSGEPKFSSWDMTTERRQLSPKNNNSSAFEALADGYEVTGINRVCAFATFRDASVKFEGEGPSCGERFAYVAEHFGIDVEGQQVQESLKSFFKCQYPQYMFIYREAFLREYHAHRARREGKYCSLPLLLAICSLGASNNSDKELSQRLSDAAESILVVLGISQSSLTTVQAFLCLAFSVIGRGNLTKGWMLSGKSQALLDIGGGIGRQGEVR